MPRFSPRSDDERLLLMVELRRQGCALSEIGPLFDMTGHAVRVATDRVLKADIRESGEPSTVVVRGYW